MASAHPSSPGQFVPCTPRLLFQQQPYLMETAPTPDSPAAVVPVLSSHPPTDPVASSPHSRALQSVPVTPRPSQADRLPQRSVVSPRTTGLMLPPESPLAARTKPADRLQEQIVPCLSPFPGSTLPRASPAKPRSAVCEGVTSPALPGLSSPCPPGATSCRPPSREALQRSRRGSSDLLTPSRSPTIRPMQRHESSQWPENNWFSGGASVGAPQRSSRESLQRARRVSFGSPPSSQRTIPQPSQAQEISRSPVIDWFSGDAIFD